MIYQNLPELTQGNNGDAVRFLQQVLLRLYYSGRIMTKVNFNSVFDSQTEQAVTEFQIAYNLEFAYKSIPNNGIVDKDTWRAIGDSIYSGAAGKSPFNFKIRPQFDFAYKFSEGLALVGQHNQIEPDELEDLFFINHKGKEVINIFDLGFDRADSFYEKRSAVFRAPQVSKTIETYNFIDINGVIISEYEYDAFTFEIPIGFFEGYALVYTMSEDLSMFDQLLFIDPNGKIKLNLKDLGYTWAQPFSEDLAVVFEDQSNKFGYIDKEGNVVIRPQFDFAFSFQEGFALVMKLNNNNIEEWSYINATGTQQIDLTNLGLSPFIFELFFNVSYFSNGLALVIDDTSSKFGYIDQQGNLVVKPQFDFPAYPFSEGFSLVRSYNNSGEINELYFMDKQGDKQIDVLNLGFDDGFNFLNGLADVGLYTEKGIERAYIDYDGNIIIKPQKLFVLGSPGKEFIEIYSIVNEKHGYIENPLKTKEKYKSFVFSDLNINSNQVFSQSLKSNRVRQEILQKSKNRSLKSFPKFGKNHKSLISGMSNYFKNRN